MKNNTNTTGMSNLHLETTPNLSSQSSLMKHSMITARINKHSGKSMIFQEYFSSFNFQGLIFTFWGYSLKRKKKLLYVYFSFFDDIWFLSQANLIYIFLYNINTGNLPEPVLSIFSDIQHNKLVTIIIPF